MMTNDEYEVTQTQILALAAIVGNMDLKGFLERIERCHAVGPAVDPTLYRLGLQGLHKIGHLAKTLVPFQKAVLDIRDKEGVI